MPRRKDNLAVTTNVKQTKSMSSAEVKCKTSYHDKQSGSYGRSTTKESVSSGDYTNRGRVGYKDEYKTSTTVRVGDKRSYTEYSKEEKITRVNYGGGNTNNNYGGNQICYDSDDASDGDGGYEEDHGYSSEGTGVQDDGYCDNDSDDGGGDSHNDGDSDDFNGGGSYDDNDSDDFDGGGSYDGSDSNDGYDD